MYSYSFCLKAGHYFFKKGNMKLFYKFYNMVKEMQEKG